MKKLRGVINFISFMLLLGTAGDLELDRITLIQAVIRSMIFMLIFYISRKKI